MNKKKYYILFIFLVFILTSCSSSNNENCDGKCSAKSPENKRIQEEYTYEII